MGRASPDLSEAPFDGIGGPDLLALGQGCVAEACEQVVEIVAQEVDGFGVGRLPGISEASCGAERLPVGTFMRRGAMAHVAGYCICNDVSRARLPDGQGCTALDLGSRASRPLDLLPHSAGPLAGQPDDDLLLAIVPDAKRHQDRAPERTGPSLAGQHHAIEHERLVEVGERASMEGATAASRVLATRLRDGSRGTMIFGVAHTKPSRMTRSISGARRAWLFSTSVGQKRRVRGTRSSMSPSSLNRWREYCPPGVGMGMKPALDDLPHAQEGDVMDLLEIEGLGKLSIVAVRCGIGVLLLVAVA